VCLREVGAPSGIPLIASRPTTKYRYLPVTSQNHENRGLDVITHFFTQR
jgi:hypothetical protein